MAGYSRLMGLDEDGTLAALMTHRHEVVEPITAAHHGRIVKTTGDGWLAEFGSALDAMRCALAIIGQETPLRVGIRDGQASCKGRAHTPGFEYELFVNGNRLGRGYESKGLDLEGYGETKVRTRFDVNLLSLPGAVKDVLGQDRVKARAKGKFYATGSFGRKELGFDSDAEVDLRR